MEFQVKKICNTVLYVKMRMGNEYGKTEADGNTCKISFSHAHGIIMLDSLTNQLTILYLNHSNPRSPEKRIYSIVGLSAGDGALIKKGFKIGR